MAVTSVWAIKGRVDNMIRYIANPEKTIDWEAAESFHKIQNAVQYSADQLKTEELTYVSYINCTPNHAVEQFMSTKRNWGKLGGRACYHGIQSFKPGETTADEAHAIGVALAQELWGDRFEVVVATHCNTDCYHNHFVFNSVSFVDGYKFYCMLEDEQRMRDVSDQLCREAQLSVITHPKGQKMHYAEYMARKDGKYVIRDGVRDDIDRAIRSSATRQDFMNILRSMGYTMNIYKKNGQLRDRPSLRPPDADRPVRFDGLGPEYTLEAIERRIRSNGIRRNPFPESEKPPRRYLGTFYMKGSYRNAPKATGLRSLYFYYCYKLKIFRKYPASVKRVSIFMREDLKNMDSLIAQMELLGREHIETADQLTRYKSSTESKVDQLTELRKELYNAKRRADRREDTAGSVAISTQISDITSQLKTLRKEVILCSKIEERSAQVKRIWSRSSSKKLKERSLHTMNTGADAADQIVRMTLNGVEVAAKITGTGAKELAVLLYAILKDQKKTAGKTRLTNMLKSGKELRVFAVKDTDLEKFCKEAKKYGVLYCVLKDKDSKDGLTDIMVRAEDASKINRIFERFQLATVDIGQIQQELDRVRTQQEAAMHPTDFRSADGAKQLVDAMLQPAPEPEEHPGVNPTMGPVDKMPPSEPLSAARKQPAAEPVVGTDPFPRTSVRAELNRIKQQQRQKPPTQTGPGRKNPVQNRPVHREMPPRVRHKKER